MKPLSSRNLICPVDPAFIPKYTRDSGRWYPFLDILLQRAADHVSVHQTFFPDLVDLQAELPPEEGGAGESRFIDFFKARESLARACSCFVLRGRIGVGKTSFLKWWLSLGQRADRHAMLNFNVEGKLWRERGNPGMALYLAKRFSEVLNRLADEPSFKKKRSTLIEEIRKRESVFSSSGEQFEEKFLHQSDSFREQFQSLDSQLLLACSVATANLHYQRPVWLVLDNIDMEDADTQDQFVRAAMGVFESILAYGKNYQKDVRVHLVVTARLGSRRRWQFHENAYQDITYPEPQLHSIVRRRFAEALALAWPDHPDPSLGFTIISGSHTLETKRQLREHLATASDGVYRFVALALA